MGTKHGDCRQEPVSTGEVPAPHNLHLVPQLRARVFRIQFGEFAEDFFGALVAGHGDGDLDFHDLVAADAFFRS